MDSVIDLNCSSPSNLTNITVEEGTCPYDTSIYIKILGTIIFVIVWPFIVLDIKFFPLGRPAAALVGAALMVLFQVVTQGDVYEIQGQKGSLQTVFLLVGMMMLSYYYDREGLLKIMTLKIFGKNKPFHHILWKVCVMTAVLSAFITNDAACLVVTPLLLTEFVNQERDKRELLPLCLGIATSANIGGASTIFGNPQNAFIASEAGVNLLQFFIAELPAAVVGLGLNIVLIYCFVLIRMKVKKLTLKRKTDVEAPPPLSSKNIALGTLSSERQAVALQYDQSDDPHVTSDISKERDSLYAVEDFSGIENGDTPSISNGINGTAGNNEDKKDEKEMTERQRKFRLYRKRGFLVWLVVITAVMIILLAIPPSVAEFNLGCIPLAASIFTMLIDTIVNRKYAYDVMLKIDWTIILMFMGLFVWLEGFQNTCFPYLVFNEVAPYMNLKTVEGVLLFSIFVIIGSNIFSNVPLVILIVNRITGLCGDVPCEGPLGGLLLAWISTIAGNFTLIGSVANLIVAEKARSSANYRISFLGYLVFGLPSTLIIIYVCLPIVYYMGLLAAKV